MARGAAAGPLGEQNDPNIGIMRREYDFSKGVRGRAPMRRRRQRREDDELKPAQERALRRRLRDLDNPIRYLLVSQMGRRFALYYNVADDVYVMNDPRGATLFKRRNAAMAIRALLGPRIRLLRCNSKRVKDVRVPVLRAKPRAPAARLSPTRRLRLAAGARPSRSGQRRRGGPG